MRTKIVDTYVRNLLNSTREKNADDDLRVSTPVNPAFKGRTLVERIIKQ